MTTLAKLVLSKTGLTLKDFCEQHLKSEYKTFQMRMRKKKYYPAEVVYVCWFLGVSCQEAFGLPYSKLVMFQGKHEVPDKVQEMWDKADLPGKDRLLSLIGLNGSVWAPKPTEKIVEAPPQAVDFFEDTYPVQAAESAPKEKEAPKGPVDPLEQLFQETY